VRYNKWVTLSEINWYWLRRETSVLQKIMQNHRQSLAKIRAVNMRQTLGRSKMSEWRTNLTGVSRTGGSSELSMRLSRMPTSDKPTSEMSARLKETLSKQMYKSFTPLMNCSSLWTKCLQRDSMNIIYLLLWMCSWEMQLLLKRKIWTRRHFRGF